MPSEAEVMWEPSDDRLGRLEAALVGAETAIPCMRCSLRGGRTLPHPRHLRLPRAALLGVGGSKVPPTLSEGSDRESVCSSLGGDSVRGRGRAATLRERARKVRERTALPHSSRSAAGDDIPTSVGSSRHSSVPTDGISEDGSLRSASPSYYPQQDTPTRSYQPQHDAPTRGYHPQHDAPTHSYQPQHDLPTRPDQAPQDALARQAPQDVPAGRAPQDAPSGQARRRKFVAIDMRSAYEEHESELLVGIPAGAENSHQFTGGSHYHPRTSGFKLGCDDYQTPDFHPQREPKVHSILDFPGLRQDRTSKEINFMNTAPRKQESMKSIASFISEGPLVSEEAGPVREEEEEGEGSQETSGSGCVVVFDHVPEAVSKQDLTDLIQPYGQVDRVSVHPTGLTYTAHVIMREAGGAQWVVDILDGSEALLPAGADGRALSVYLLVQ